MAVSNKLGKLNILWDCDECVKTKSNKSTNEVCSEISDMNMDKLIKVLKEQLKSSEFVIKTHNEDLLTAQTEIKKHKEEKFHLEHLLFLQVEEVVKLENKVKRVELKSDKTCVFVTNKILKNHRLGLSPILSCADGITTIGNVAHQIRVSSGSYGSLTTSAEKSKCE